MRKETIEMVRFNSGRLHQIQDELILIDYLSVFQKDMQWLRTSGDRLLRKKTITFREWKRLEKGILRLNYSLTCPVFAIIHLKILQKAAHSLVVATEKKTLRSRRLLTLEVWLDSILRILDINNEANADLDPLEFGTGFTKYLRWQVVENLIPVAQAFESEHYLKRISQLRYPDDPYSRGRFFETHNK